MVSGGSCHLASAAGCRLDTLPMIGSAAGPLSAELDPMHIKTGQWLQSADTASHHLDTLTSPVTHASHTHRYPALDRFRLSCRREMGRIFVLFFFFVSPVPLLLGPRCAAIGRIFVCLLVIDRQADNHSTWIFLLRSRQICLLASEPIIDPFPVLIECTF
jgi:hypothetical protein